MVVPKAKTLVVNGTFGYQNTSSIMLGALQAEADDAGFIVFEKVVIK